MQETKLPTSILCLFLAFFCISPAFAESLSTRVSASGGDGRENFSDHIAKISSGSMEVAVHPTYGSQYNGFQFTGLNIPKGATITSAYIQFTCYSTANVSPASYTIRAEASDSAAVFAAVTGNISSRGTTSSSATWAPPDWTVVNESGANEKTSDLTALVQEVVNRPGWASGNSMAFIITGTGCRVVCTFDGPVPAQAAQLNITWTTGAPSTHTITASAGANGSIAPSGAVSVSNGTSQAFTITANNGYHVSNVVVDSSSVGAVSAYTFSNVTTNHTISASFATNAGTYYTINASAGANGSISPSGSVQVAQNGSQTFTISASGGYNISTVLVDSVSVGAVGSYTFNNVTAGHTISASFKAATSSTNSLTTAISVSSDDARENVTGGACKINSGSLDLVVNPDPTKGPQYVAFRFNSLGIPKGATITAAYIQFTSYAGSTNTSSMTIKAQAADNAATFAEVTYNISSRTRTTASASWAPSDWAAADLAGSGQRTPDLSTLVQEVVNRAGWNSGNSMAFIFDGSGNRVVCSQDGLTPTKNASLHVEWSTAPLTYSTITATAAANGSISPSGAVQVVSGNSQVFAITPSAGYNVATVTVDGVSIGSTNGYTFINVTTNHTISASFAIKHYTIAASSSANGSISPIGNVDVTHGSSRTFTITSNTGYHVSNVLVDAVSVGAVGSYTFSNITTGHTIIASFAVNHYTITASAGANGSISPAGNVDVTHGSSLSFTMSPNLNYHVADVLVDGVSTGAVNSYTFTNLTRGHTISASFAFNTGTYYTVTASAGANGYITPSGGVQVAKNSSQTFTISPNAGYNVSNVVVDGGSVGASNSYTFGNVQTNHTISATFSARTFTITASAGVGGSISPVGGVGVAYGGNQSFTITPNTGYNVSNVTVDGVSVGASNSYTFSNVVTNHTISAAFSARMFTITASAGANGSISPNGAVQVAYGSSQIFTFTNSPGYRVSNVLVDGASVGAPDSYVFTSIAANHTISASFDVYVCRVVVRSDFGSPSPPAGTNSITPGTSIKFSVAGSPLTNGMTTVTDGFEDASLTNTLPWTTSGDASWATTTGDKQAGLRSAQNGSIGDNGSTILELTLQCANGNISFWRKVSSEEDSDYLTFAIDGVTTNAWSGEVAWGFVSHPVSAGSHTFTWTYTKDYSYGLGQDSVWIDDVSAPIPLAGVKGSCTGWTGAGNIPSSGTGTNTASIAINNDSSITWIWSSQYWLSITAGPNGGVNRTNAWYNSGSNVTIQATANSGYRFANWSGNVPPANSNDNPLVLTMDQPRAITANFRSNTYDLVVVSPYGTPNPPVGTNLYASNSSVRCSVAGSPVTGAGGTNSDSFETGDFSRWSWSRSGDVNWTIVSDEKNSGAYSAKSGAIGDSQSSTLEVTLPCVDGTMSFWRKVSSEDGYDYLRLYVDGSEAGSWTGELPWEQVTIPVSAGFHTFTWTYSKDSASVSGQDCAWIDDIGVPASASSARYVCSGWTGSGNVTASGTTTNTGLFTMTQNSSIAWNWRTEYWLDTAAGPNGTVNIGDGWHNSGTNVTIQATANSTYHFAGWTGDVSGTRTNDNPLILTMDQGYTITANFASGTGSYYVITATAGSNGIITPSGAVSVLAGTDRQFTITPNGGCSITNVKVDGSSIGVTNSYTFVNVTSDHTISALFEAGAGYAAKGTPTSWLDNYGLTGDYNARELQDTDNDGNFNWEEYVVGTDPTNRNSRFAVGVSNLAGKLVLRLPSVVATGPYYSKVRCYELQKRTNLYTTSWQSVPGYTGIVANGSVITFTNTLTDRMTMYRAGAWLQ